MIELAEEQMLALENAEATPPPVMNRRTNETFVLLQIDEYERRQDQADDDSPWMREELQSLAWEAAERTSWDEYNDPVKEP